MKIWKIGRRLAPVLAALVLLLSPLAVPAAAYQDIDTHRTASLTVRFKDFSGVEFSIYRVASVSENCVFTLTGAFRDYPVSVNGLNSSGWRALARTLDSYVARDDPAALRTGETNRSGRVSFSGLPTGLYLVVGEQYQEEEWTYTPEAFLICLPNQVDGEWEYDVTANCKYDQEENPPETVDRKVLKVWEDDGNEQLRPRSITVQLLKDGRVYDTVTLSAANNWRYTWRELDGDAVWRVVEYRTPGDYTVSVDREGITFVITNTYAPETDIPDEPPPRSEFPPPPDEDIPDDPTPQGEVPPDEDIPDEPPPTTDVPPDEPGLPQTGMLWWPVPVLAGSGIILILLGWLWRRHEEEYET